MILKKYEEINLIYLICIITLYKFNVNGFLKPHLHSYSLIKYNDGKRVRDEHTRAII